MGEFTKRDSDIQPKELEFSCDDCGNKFVKQILSNEVWRMTTRNEYGRKVKTLRAACSCGSVAYRLEEDTDIEAGNSVSGPKTEKPTQVIGKDVEGNDVKIIDKPERRPSDIGEKLAQEKFLRKARQQCPDKTEKELDQMWEQYKLNQQ